MNSTQTAIGKGPHDHLAINQTFSSNFPLNSSQLEAIKNVSRHFAANLTGTQPEAWESHVLESGVKRDVQTTSYTVETTLISGGWKTVGGAVLFMLCLLAFFF